jgi:hypothetical protein
VNNTVMNDTVNYTPPAEDGAFVSIADTERRGREAFRGSRRALSKG